MTGEDWSVTRFSFSMPNDTGSNPTFGGLTYISKRPHEMEFDTLAKIASIVPVEKSNQKQNLSTFGIIR